jgi:hypothetical protein
MEANPAIAVHEDSLAGGTGFEAVLNFRVAHLSRCVTGGAFDFGFDFSSVSLLTNSFE